MIPLNKSSCQSLTESQPSVQKISCCYHFLILKRKILLTSSKLKTSLKLRIHSLIKTGCKRSKKRCQLRAYRSLMKQKRLRWWQGNQKKTQDHLKSLPQELLKTPPKRKNGSNLSLNRSCRNSFLEAIETANPVQKSTNWSLSTTVTFRLQILSNVCVTWARIWSSSWRIEADRWSIWKKN